MTASVRVERLGRERATVLVVDDLLSDPGPLVRDAHAATYGTPEIKAFPGVRAPAPPDYPAVLRRALLPLLRDVFDLQGCEVVGGTSDFSLVTRRPQSLELRQRIPHTDTPDPGLIALLHYLTPGGTSGTSFYRHRTTGFESITADRRAAFEATLSRELQDAQPTGYIGADTALFERIGGYDGVFNRLIAYRGSLLHSGDIAPDFGFSDDPRTDRLTANTFLLLRRPGPTAD